MLIPKNRLTPARQGPPLPSGLHNQWRHPPVFPGPRSVPVPEDIATKNGGGVHHLTKSSLRE